MPSFVDLEPELIRRGIKFTCSLNHVPWESALDKKLMEKCCTLIKDVSKHEIFLMMVQVKRSNKMFEILAMYINKIVNYNYFIEKNLTLLFKLFHIKIVGSRYPTLTEPAEPNSYLFFL